MITKQFLKNLAGNNITTYYINAKTHYTGFNHRKPGYSLLLVKSEKTIFIGL